MATNIIFRHTMLDLPDTTKIVSVTLQHKDDLFGVRGLISGDVVVANGTPMPEVSAGVFVYDLETAPLFDGSQEHEFSMRVLQDDGDIYWATGVVPIVHPRGPSPSIEGFAYTGRELAQLVGAKLGDPNLERYSETEAIEELNAVMADFALETKAISDTIIVQTLADTPEYDIYSLIEAAGLRQLGAIYRISFNGEDTPALRPGTQQALDLFRYQDFTGTPSKWNVDTLDWGKVRIWGNPDVDGDPLLTIDGNLSVTYLALPLGIQDPLDYPDNDLPATAQNAFIYGAARNLLMCESDTGMLEKAVFMHGKYMYEKAKFIREQNLGKATDDMRPL